MDLKIDFWPHPITSEGRAVVHVLPGQPLSDAMAPVLPFNSLAVAIVNGEIVRRESWGNVFIKNKDIIQVRSVVGDTGGGGGGSNPIASIISIAVIVGAFAIGGPAGAALASQLGLAAGGAAAGAVASGLTALIATGGLILVNTIFPPRLPSSESLGGSTGERRRVYSLQGGSNRIRAYEPLPLLLGSHRMFPDVVQPGYAEYDEEGDQYLSQIFDYGIGNLGLVGEHRLGETNLSRFESIVSQSGVDRITLVSGNVDTIGGGDLEFDVEFLRTTAGKTTKLSFDVSGQSFVVQRNGNLTGGGVGYTFRWRPAGSTGAWTRKIVDFDCPDGVEGRNAVRRSYTYNVPSNAYDVGVTRRTHEPTQENQTTNISLVAIRAYQDEDADFGDRNPLAIRAKATGQLYGRMENLNSDMSQLIKKWNGSTYEKRQISGNCGDVLLAFARGWRRNGELIAGMGLTDPEINLDEIKGFAEHCTLHGLECNVIIEDGRDIESTIRLITQCGWGSKDETSGKFGVIWEDANRPMTALVTPANIIADSISVVYENDGLADEIEGVFFDKDSDYQPNTIRRNIPGLIGVPERPVSIDLEGVTNGTQAAKEVNRTAAYQVYHTRVISWEMSAEGAITIKRGSVVGLSHDLAGGGVGGRLLEISANRRTLTPANPVTEEGFVWVWDLEGGITSSLFTLLDGNIVLPSGTSIEPPPIGVDDRPEAYRFMTFPVVADLLKVRVTGIESSGDGILRYTARDEVREYYDARVADLSYDLIPANRLYGLSDPVAGFNVTQNDLGARIFSWSLHPFIEVVGYQIRYGSSSDVFSGMIPLHEGLLVSSPFVVIDRPPAGKYRFGIVAVTRDGRRTNPAYNKPIDLTEILIGQDGEEGIGVEYIFASSVNGNAISGIANLPDPDWDYDIPALANGVRRGNATYYDGTPTDIGSARPFIIRFRRAVPGSPAQNEDIGTVAWIQENSIRSYGLEGTDGEEGIGVEYIFASSVTGDPISGSANLPDPDWDYDISALANGVRRGNATYYDGTPSNVGPSRPFLIRFRRAVPGSPAQNEDIGTVAWIQENSIRSYGLEGTDGEEGIGVEYIFASSVTGDPISGSANLPDPDWDYDISALANGVRRGNATYYDGTPSNVGPSRPFLIRFRRAVPGSPAQNEDIGTVAWIQENSIRSYGLEGTDGEEGIGVEYIFASSVTGDPISGSANLPDPDWDYDISALANGVRRGNATYYDGTPSNVGPSRPFLIRFRRAVPGSPAQNEDIGTVAWIQENSIRSYGLEGTDGAGRNRNRVHLSLRL